MESIFLAIAIFYVIVNFFMSIWVVWRDLKNLKIQENNEVLQDQILEQRKTIRDINSFITESRPFFYNGKYWRVILDEENNKADK